MTYFHVFKLLVFGVLICNSNALFGRGKSSRTATRHPTNIQSSRPVYNPQTFNSHVNQGFVPGRPNYGVHPPINHVIPPRPHQPTRNSTFHPISHNSTKPIGWNVTQSANHTSRFNHPNSTITNNSLNFGRTNNTMFNHTSGYGHFNSSLHNNSSYPLSMYNRTGPFGSQQYVGPLQQPVPFNPINHQPGMLPPGSINPVGSYPQPGIHSQMPANPSQGALPTAVSAPNSGKGSGILNTVAGGLIGGVVAGGTGAVISNLLHKDKPQQPNQNPPPLGNSGPEMNNNNNNPSGTFNNPGTATNQNVPYPGVPLRIGGAPVFNGGGNSPIGIPNGIFPAKSPIDIDIMILSEKLFGNIESHTNEFVELNLQKRVKFEASKHKANDEAPYPLFRIHYQLNNIPTVAKFNDLFSYYERVNSLTENVEKTRIENIFIEEILKTPIMKEALNWLVQRKYISGNYLDILRSLWFSPIDGGSNGFKRIFLVENLNSTELLLSMNNWIYLAHLEVQYRMKYWGFMDTTSLSGEGFLIKLNYSFQNIPVLGKVIFAGTPLELEMALYTVCFYVKTNNLCPISLGGAKFFIHTEAYNNLKIIKSAVLSF